MTLAEECLGLGAVIVFAIWLNRIITIYGFKRDPNFTHFEMPLDQQECEFIYSEDDQIAGLIVNDIFVTNEDLAFATVKEKNSIYLLHRELLREYNRCVRYFWSLG